MAVETEFFMYLRVERVVGSTETQYKIIDALYLDANRVRVELLVLRKCVDPGQNGRRVEVLSNRVRTIVCCIVCLCGS